jgi:hypothetical protein
VPGVEGVEVEAGEDGVLVIDEGGVREEGRVSIVRRYSSVVRR